MPATIGRPLERFSVSNLRGGLDVKSSPQELASNPKYRNRLSRANHIEFPKAGGVSKRRDAVRYNATTLGAAVHITGGFQFRHSNGTNENLCGTTDGRVVRLNTDGTTTNLGTGLTVDTRWYFDQFNDLVLICNRTDAPRSYDGTTFGAAAGSPPATGGPVAVHSNRAFMLDATNTRRVSWCALNTPTDWTTASNAGSMTVSSKIGSPLMFLLPLTSELALGHRDTVTRLQGTAPSTYAITNAVPAQVSIGGVSHQGAVFGANDGWYLSQRGVHRLGPTQDFGDLEESYASELIDPYFTADTDFTVSLNQLDKAVACYDSQNNRLYFGVDTNGDGQNDTVFCLDVFLNLATDGDGGWSVWPDVSCASLWPVYTGANGVEVFMGGYDGFVRRLNVADDENAIDAEFSHTTDLGKPGIQKNLRRLVVYASEEGDHVLTVTVTADFGQSGGQVFTMSLLGDTDLVGSSFVIGTSVLGARSQIIKRLDMGILGEFFEVAFGNANAGEGFTVFKYDAWSRERRISGTTA
jgi:hypothetical protein